MGLHNSDPRLSLYDKTELTFQQVTGELDVDQEVTYLSVHPDAISLEPFFDPGSSFEADEVALTSIEKHAPMCFAIGIDLFKGGLHYARQADLLGPKGSEVAAGPHNHLIVAAPDTPPTVMHNEYFGSIYNTLDDARTLTAAGFAEVLSFNRAARIVQLIERLSADHIDRRLL